MYALVVLDIPRLNDVKTKKVELLDVKIALNGELGHEFWTS